MFSKKEVMLISVLLVAGVVLIIMSILLRLPSIRPGMVGSSNYPLTQAATVTPIPSLTITSSATPTTTPTITPVPSPTVVPHFGEVTFGTGVRGDSVLNQGDTFVNTAVVYAVWSYRGLRDGLPYRLIWALDGDVFVEERLTWDAGRYGAEGAAYAAHISDYTTGELPPGNYRLDLFIEDRQEQLATFVILAPTPTPLPPTPTPEPDARARGRLAARSLVQLIVDSDRLFVKGQGGSGSIVDGVQGLIVTNWHVVSDRAGRLLNEGGYVRVCVTADPDALPEWTYWAQVLPEYSDPDLDVAVLRITHWAANDTPVSEPLNLPAIPLGDSAAVRRGDRVLLLGFPDYAGGSLSWTEGVVTTRDDQWIKSDAGISHGHSGGMMLNERGELIAIPTQYERTSVGAVLAKARPINLAHRLVASAIAAGLSSPFTRPSYGGTMGRGAFLVVLGVSNLNLRSGPSLDDEVVGDVALSTLVQVLDEPRWDGARFWYYVQVQGSALTGWASGRYLAPWEIAQMPLLFHSDRYGSTDLFSMHADGTQVVRLTDALGDEGDASWSPDRTRIVFAADRAGNADLYIMNATGGQWAQLTSDSGHDIHPVWSRDGSRIAFVSDRDGDWEIYVINTDGTGLRQITFNDVWDSYPTWSPDDTQLAFTSRQGGDYDLYVVDLNTGELRRLTANPYTDVHPAWAPSGDEIAYTTVIAEGGALRKEIAILNVRNPSYPRRVTVSEPGEGLNSYPDWSPDGQWIVFVSDRDGDGEIYIIPASGGLTMNLSQATGSNEGSPTWSR